MYSELTCVSSSVYSELPCVSSIWSRLTWHWEAGFRLEPIFVYNEASGAKVTLLKMVQSDPIIISSPFTESTSLKLSVDRSTLKIKKLIHAVNRFLDFEFFSRILFLVTNSFYILVNIKSINYLDEMHPNCFFFQPCGRPWMTSRIKFSLIRGHSNNT